MPFQQMQLDTKHILDKDALPAEVYAHIQHHNLPLFEWNIIDVATRIRFTAYSHELSAVFASMFLSLILLWLRAHNVRGSLRIRLDNVQSVKVKSASERSNPLMNNHDYRSSPSVFH